MEGCFPFKEEDRVQILYQGRVIEEHKVSLIAFFLNKQDRRSLLKRFVMNSDMITDIRKYHFCAYLTHYTLMHGSFELFEIRKHEFDEIIEHNQDILSTLLSLYVDRCIEKGTIEMIIKLN